MSDDPMAGPGLRSSWQFEVTWGDCDASGMVFYPRYYQWFDASTHAMLTGVGLEHHVLRRSYGIIGTPLVQASAKFRSPATYGDTLTAESRVSRVGQRSFTVLHRLFVGARVVVDGEEIRVWGANSSASPLELHAVAIPEDVRTLLAGG